MSCQKQGGGFAIGRQHIAYFHAEHLQNGIAGRDHLHFRQLRIDVGRLGTRLRDTHFRSCDIFLLCFG